MSNNISKFHGEYLKCIVTKYPSVTEYLGNSGSLIVLQEDKTKGEREYHRNYIYLGDEFLASGYGFASKAQREIAERIVDEYDNVKDMLLKRDARLKAELKKAIDDILNRLNSFIESNGGSIDNTTVTVVDKDGEEEKINTRDLLFNNEFASYDDLEVLEVRKYVNDILVEGNEVWLPIGSYIEEIRVEIDYKKNDSGGIEKIETYHHNLYADSDAMDSVILKYDRILSQENIGYGTLIYRKIIENGKLIDRFIEDVIEDIRIFILGTPVENYKMYPLLEKNYGIQIPSIANKINPSVKILNTHICIHPQFYMYYAIDTYAFEEFYNTHELNSFRDFDKTIVQIPDIDKMNKLYIAIPSKFTINRINVINSINERYNWMGAFVIKRGIDIFANRNTESHKDKLIECNIYMIDLSKTKFKESEIKLELEIVYNNAKLEKDADYYENEENQFIILKDQQPDIKKFENPDIVMNEQFNDMYWVNSYMMEDTIDQGYEDLNDRLDKIQQNCTK